MDAVDVEDRCMVSTNGDVSKRDVTTAKYFFKKKLFWCTAVKISFIEYIVLLKMKRYCTVLHFDIQIDDSNQRRGWRGFVLVSRVNPMMP